MILWRKLSSKSKCVALILISFVFVIASCNKDTVTDDSSSATFLSEENNSESTISDAIELAPTGLSEGMITPPQIMYQGVIFEYKFMGKNTKLPEGFEEAGTILVVDDYEKPSQDFYAGGREITLAMGQQVFASEADHSRIAVFCDDGYYMFYCDD